MKILSSGIRKVTGQYYIDIEYNGTIYEVVASGLGCSISCEDFTIKIDDITCTEITTFVNKYIKLEKLIR